MIKILMSVVALACASLNVVSSAKAGQVQCGERRTIERSTSEQLPVTLCWADGSADLLKAAVESAKAAATGAAEKRLQKFAAECSAAGGTATPVSGNADAETYDRESFTGFHYEAALDRWFFGYKPVCKIDAHAVVTHSCVCK